MMEPSGPRVERAPASLLAGEGQQTMDPEAETRWSSVLVHTWRLDRPRARHGHHALLPATYP